jgi:ubiquinone/menaquinone biosynthesis C-methylase UbiE
MSEHDVGLKPDPREKRNPGEKPDERESGLRRVKRFYSISAEREWMRLEQPVDGRLEFAVHRAWIGRYLPPPPARVLDIGGGPGRYSIWLAEQGYAVTLADLSPDLLALAKQKAAEAGVELEGIVEANACDLSQFGDASFDAVLCMGPLYHLVEEEDRNRVRSELFRVLKPGGRAFVAFLNRFQTLRVAANQDIPFFTPYTAEMIKKYHYTGVLDWQGIPGTFNLAYLFYPREVAPFMEAAGFQTTELISSQSNGGDIQKHLALLAERQPELYEWLLGEMIEQANEPSIRGSGFHILYIGNKPEGAQA